MKDHKIEKQIVSSDGKKIINENPSSFRFFQRLLSCGLLDMIRFPNEKEHGRKFKEKGLEHSFFHIHYKTIHIRASKGN